MKTLAKESSPQSTETVQSASEPGSVNEPRSKECDEPSFELWPLAAVTLGATFATSTTCTDSEALSEAPSESLTLILTLVVAGPSGKKQSKLPPFGTVESEPSTYWPPVPQSGYAGSLTENVS